MSQRTLSRPFSGASTVAASGEQPPAARSFNAFALLRKLIVPLGLLVLWQLVCNAGIYNRSQLPPPIAVLKAARQLWQQGELWTNIAASLGRVARGFLIGSAAAIGLGLLVGLSRIAEELLSPTIGAIRAIPSLAWVPMLILWMGIDERPKITLVAIGVFFPVYTNLFDGIRQIDRKLIEAASAYGYSGPSLAWHVLLPASLPSLFTGLRSGLAQGWLFLVAAELIAASRGLGFLLIDSQNSGRSDVIVLSIIILAILGKTSDWALSLVERRCLRWSDSFGARR